MNGTKQLIDCLFKGNESAFIEHFVKSCFFIPINEVKKRAKEMLTDISNNAKINVRFGKTYLKECFETEPKKNVLKNKPKKEIRRIASEEALFFKDGKVKVSIDSTGNQAVVFAIEKATGYTINGNSSDFFNYTLSHVWPNTTHNPYYFSSLWNIVIIPNYLNYIMDKPEKQDPINGKIQKLIKAICIELYNPDALMNNKIKVDSPIEYIDLAKKAINEGWVNFLDKKPESSSGEKIIFVVYKEIFIVPFVQILLKKKLFLTKLITRTLKKSINLQIRNLFLNALNLWMNMDCWKIILLFSLMNKNVKKL